MDKIKTLSAAIRYGSTFIKEVPQFMIGRECGCAIGTAYLACVDTETSVYPGSDILFTSVAQRFQVPRSMLEVVSREHFTDRMTRAQCADWLEAQGY
jgi:hypothetical protein